MAYRLAERHDMMDMDSATDGSSTMSMGILHFSIGDTLWFAGWTPTTSGAVFGACFGLFMLAGLGRLLLAVFFQLNLALRVRSTDALEREYIRLLSPREANTVRSSTPSSGTNSDNSATNEKRVEIITRAKRRAATAPPMMLSHDVPRAILVTAIAAISYFLMLAVMTGSLYYFFAILLGIFAGEVAFGRFGGMAGH